MIHRLASAPRPAQPDSLKQLRHANERATHMEIHAEVDPECLEAKLFEARLELKALVGK